MNSTTRDKSTPSSGPAFIDNTPPGEDLLEGKSQELIANSITRIVRDETMDRRLIGLDGDWGAGKSNLVGILSRKLDSSHRVIIYDAWAHQEDLKRRTFLEELTEDLFANGLLDESEWKEKLKKLLAKTTETKTTTNPRLSNGVLVAGIVLVSTPLFSSLADSFASDNLKAFVAGMPLLVGFFAWIFGSLIERKLLGPAELFYLYKDKQLEEETFTTINEIETSVVGFRRWMADLSESLVERKLVIVFDNTDRLPGSKAQEIWSLINTFFAESQYDGIWVIVPFNRQHLAGLFENDFSVTEEFLSKSFSVVFRVAPPVLTDWQSFFKLKFRDAFSDIDEAEITIVLGIYDALTRSITPRGIIWFVNEIVALRIVSEKEIPIKYLAIFALKRNMILRDPINEILKADYLGGLAPLFEDDDELPNCMAALVYQVPVSSASQVSLQREIQIAVRETNHQRLEELSKHKYFGEMLEQTVLQRQVELEQSIVTLGDFFSVSNSDESVGSDRKDRLWNALGDRSLSEFAALKIVGSPVRILLENISEDVGKHVIDKIVVALRNAEDFNGATFGSGMKALDEIVAGIDWAPDLKEFTLQFEKDPDVFVDYVGEVGDDFEKYGLQCDARQLADFLDASIPGAINELPDLSPLVEAYDLDPARSKISTLIEQGKIEEENILAAISLGRRLSSKRHNKLPTLPDNRIHKLLDSLEDGSDLQAEMLAMRLARGGKYQQQPGRGANLLKSTDENLARRVAMRIEAFADFGTLIMLYLSWKQKILKAVVRELIFTSYGTSRLNVIQILPRFSDICEQLEVTPRDLLTRLNGWRKPAKDSVTKDNAREIVSDIVFIREAATHKAGLAEHCLKSLAQSFRESVGTDSWVDAFRDEGSFEFESLVLLIRSGKIRKLPSEIIAAYKQVLGEIASLEFEPSAFDQWETVNDKLPKENLQAKAKDMRDELIANGGVKPSTFKALRKPLIRWGDMKGRSGDVVRRILSPLIDQPGGLELVLEDRRHFERILVDAGDDASDFKEKIREELATNDSSTDLEKLASAIGVNVGAEASGESGEDAT